MTNSNDAQLLVHPDMVVALQADVRLLAEVVSKLSIPQKIHCKCGWNTLHCPAVHDLLSITDMERLGVKML